jgi:hypothetical protein
MTRVTPQSDGYIPSLPSNIAGPGGHPLVGVRWAKPPGLAALNVHGLA